MSCNIADFFVPARDALPCPMPITTHRDLVSGGHA
jgi:hypothetical protein